MTIQEKKEKKQEKSVLYESSAYQVHTQGSYTLEDYYALPVDQRVELIDGYFYHMAAPPPHHQLIAGEVYQQIAGYIKGKGGSCLPFMGPVDVQLDCRSLSEETFSLFF